MFSSWTGRARRTQEKARPGNSIFWVFRSRIEWWSSCYRRGVRRVAVSVLLVAVACGARTGLLAPSDTGAPVEAGPLLPDGGAVVRGTCTSQLQPGAPTPIAGYCSTRAHLAPAALPVS